MAGLALSLCMVGCGSEGGPPPAPASQDEEAALEDAAAMLEVREPAEPTSDGESSAPPEP